MPPSEPIDPRRSMADCFAYELRRQRQARGLSQDSLAKELYVTRSTVQAYESVRNRPDEEFAKRCDTFFGTGQLFQALWFHSRREHLNEWFEEYKGHELESTQIHSYQPLNIPGLLQTEDYMRAGAKDKGAEAEAVVADRLLRREILTKENAPFFFAVIDEAAIRRPVGGWRVLCEQLEHVLEMSELPNVSIQVVPETTGWYSGLDGALVLLTKRNGARVGYVEAQFGGRLIEDPAEVTGLGILFDQIRGKATSEEASLALIRSTLERMGDDRVAQEQP
jgi:transcriptional regulator with XRE-family HTH domain